MYPQWAFDQTVNQTTYFLHANHGPLGKKISGIKGTVLSPNMWKVNLSIRSYTGTVCRSRGFESHLKWFARRIDRITKFGTCKEISCTWRVFVLSWLTLGVLRACQCFTCSRDGGMGVKFGSNPTISESATLVRDARERLMGRWDRVICESLFHFWFYLCAL